MNVSLSSLLLLGAVTLCYAGYNVFVKMSGNLVPATATTTVAATICLQVAALAVTLCLSALLLVKGDSVFRLSMGAYGWAILAGICIGLAEIGYFYLFAGISNIPAMPAGLAIPTVVSGTVVIAVITSYLFFNESIGSLQLAGAGLIVSGVVLLYLGSSQ